MAAPLGSKYPPVLDQLEQIVVQGTKPLKEWAKVRTTVTELLDHQNDYYKHGYAQDAIAQLVMLKAGLEPSKKNYWFLAGIGDRSIEEKQRNLIDRVRSLLQKILLQDGAVNLADEIERMQEVAQPLTQELKQIKSSLLLELQTPAVMRRAPYIELDRLCDAYRSYNPEDESSRREVANGVFWFLIALANLERVEKIEEGSLNVEGMRKLESYLNLQREIEAIMGKLLTDPNFAFEDEMERLKPSASLLLTELSPDIRFHRMDGLHGGAPIGDRLDLDLYPLHEAFSAYLQSNGPETLQMVQDQAFAYLLKKYGVEEENIGGEMLKLRAVEAFGEIENQLQSAIQNSQNTQQFDENIALMNTVFESADVVWDTLDQTRRPLQRSSVLRSGFESAAHPTNQ